jgi:hypothetical protein
MAKDFDCCRLPPEGDTRTLISNNGREKIGGLEAATNTRKDWKPKPTNDPWATQNVKP